MFLDYFGLREQPFGVTPDPRFLYFSPSHREALASLFYGIDMGRGFVALIAQPGMGKTTLLFQLRECLKDSSRCGFLFQTQCDSRELLRYVLDALGLDGREQDVVRMHARLNEFLFREALAGRRVTLIIDEAQNLSDQVLETVRLLSDFEASDRKLLHIVLAGQPELARRLRRPGSSQLRQRISVLSHLNPLSAVEVDRYMQHRLEVAGRSGPELFTPAARALIAESSQGIPRNINNVCFNALSLGCASGSKKIGPELIAEAASDLSPDCLIRPSPPVPAVCVPEIHSTTSGDHDEIQRPPAMPPIIASLSAALPVVASSPGVARVPASDPVTPRLDVPPLVTPPVSTSPEVLHRVKGWFRGSASDAWIFRIALLSAMSGCLGVYFGARAGKAEALTLARSSSGAPSNAVSLRLEVPPAPSTPVGPVSAQFQRLEQPSPDEYFSPSFVIWPNDTLSKLRVEFTGYHDPTALAEIQKLNQVLKDSDRIHFGQEVHVPGRPPN
jgi:general secretion pathway protein A